MCQGHPFGIPLFCLSCPRVARRSPKARVTPPWADLGAPLRDFSPSGKNHHHRSQPRLKPNRERIVPIMTGIGKKGKKPRSGGTGAPSAGESGVPVGLLTTDRTIVGRFTIGPTGRRTAFSGGTSLVTRHRGRARDVPTDGGFAGGNRKPLPEKTLRHLARRESWLAVYLDVASKQHAQAARVENIDAHRVEKAHHSAGRTTIRGQAEAEGRKPSGRSVCVDGTESFATPRVVRNPCPSRTFPEGQTTNQRRPEHRQAGHTLLLSV